MLGSEIENAGVLETFLISTLPLCPGNPSSMVVHVCCQKVRHGHGCILVWKQNSFGITVFLEQCLVEKGLKSKCRRFCNLLSACSHQRPWAILWSYSSFHPCLFVFHTRRPQFPCLMRHCQSGSKVYNGICSKMLTGSGNKVLVRQKGLQS